MSEILHELTKLSVSEIKGIGPKNAERLRRFSIENVHDLVFHLPTRYEDRSQIVLAGDAPFDSNVTALCTVLSIDIRNGKSRTLSVTVRDNSSTFKLVFFRFAKQQLSHFKPGQHLRVYGTFKNDGYGLQMAHPQYKQIATLNPKHALEKHHHPIYKLTDGITQESMAKYVDSALGMLLFVKDERLLVDSDKKLLETLRFLHKAPQCEDVDLLNRRRHPNQILLIKEEMLVYSLSLMKIRESSDKNKAIPIKPAGKLRGKWLSSLDFKPTNAQQRVSSEIDSDLVMEKPMMRLVQGDVGSGKTLVAAMAAINVIEHGGQVALMAPTEILAEQHAIGFKEWLEPFGVRVAWLAGKMKKKEKESTLQSLAAGEIDLLIGTHSIFQDNVMFSKLLLIIIDEQHKFGVGQRLKLREKGFDGNSPHQLIMTATPIPRTLAMVSYADLDTSVIDELPPGRSPVKTVAIPQERRVDIINRIREVCQKQNKQVYWVCTLIDESEVIESEAASEVFETLKNHLPELKVGLVHGRMKSDEKQKIMSEFKLGEVDLLVATTVIEVGVNVPNASLMIIENPERLGLAQLHQLRGRVGRGSVESSCVLLYKKPLSDISSQRLTVLRESNDGFVVAQRDLEIRGPGELIGVRQKGGLALKMADISKDEKFLPAMNAKAVKLIKEKSSEIDATLLRWNLLEKQYGNV